MPDENNPVIYVEYSAEAFPPTNWTSIKEYAVDFNAKNSGILKTPECTLNLKNTNGRYTGNGALTLGLNKLLRVRADVRGTIDTLFYGRIVNLDSKNEKQKNEYLTITGRGMTQKLLNDSVTHDYLNEENMGNYTRTMAQVISHLLTYPDTGEATGIGLVYSAGALGTTKAKHNFDRETLLDAIKKICEYVGYTGYELVAGGGISLVLDPYGYQETSPAITIGQEVDNLGNQVIKRSFSKSTDEICNHICVHGGTTVNYPDSDRFTENGVAKGWWHVNPNCTVSDDATNYYVNSNSVKITLLSGTPEVTLDMIPTFGSNGLNVKTTKITYVNFWMRRYSRGFKVTLIDTSNKEISYQTCLFDDSIPILRDWRLEQVQMGHISSNSDYQNESIDTDPLHPYGNWKGDVAFDWQHVAKIKFNCTMGNVNIDGLCFGGFIEVNPIKDPTLAATDATSISLYGRRIMHYEDPALRDYAAIHPMADKILASTKDPITKLVVTVGAKTWAIPNQYLTVNMPIYGISNQQYRVVELEYEWSTKTKLLRSTLSLTPRYQPVTSRDWFASQLDGILKNLIW